MINLVLILAVAYPVWIVLLGTYVAATKGPQGGQYIEAFVFYFLVMAVPLVVGGLGQQLILLIVPRRWSEVERRLTSVAAGLFTIPAAFLLVRSDPDLILSYPVIGTLLVALTVYAFTIKLPE